MPAKPHRILLDRVSGYADEAAAYLRRRRHMRRPFARVHYHGGRSAAFEADSAEGEALFEAAARLIEVAGSRGSRAGGEVTDDEEAPAGESDGDPLA